MACNCGCGDTGFTDLNGLDIQNTLARKLISTVDKLRNLRVKFGLRVYEVHLVRTRWTGGLRGSGEEYVVSDEAILPVPLIGEINGLTETLQSVGLDEIGTLILTEVSGRYTEDYLRGTGPDGSPLAADETVYYEIYFPPVPGGTAQRRRFQLRSAPGYVAGKFQWTLALERARQDRTRSGDTRNGEVRGW